MDICILAITVKVFKPQILKDLWIFLYQQIISFFYYQALVVVSILKLCQPTSCYPVISPWHIKYSGAMGENPLWVVFVNFSKTQFKWWVILGWTKKNKLLNPFWSRSFPGLFGSANYRTVKNYFKTWFIPLPILICNIQRKFFWHPYWHIYACKMPYVMYVI